MITSYPKIYNLGHAAIRELLDDVVIVEEKIDGSQFSFCVTEFDRVLECRSKGAYINMDAPEKMFTRAVETVKALEPKLHPGWIYRGEYLQKPKHNTLAYDRVPNNHIILFDICTGPEDYVYPRDKSAEAASLGLECVPMLFCGKVTDYEHFTSLLERQSILGGQKIEGVVIKNYNRFGRDGKALMGKYVSEAFKETHQGDWKARNPNGKDIKQEIGQRLRTPARWEKAIQHLREAGKLENSPRDIGPLIKEINSDILEECREEVTAALFKWAWKDIARIITRGFPEWYKDKLAQQQFAPEEAV